MGTPIGNLEDLSPRARRVLSEADAIFCEDTRVTAKLTARFSIRAPRVSCPAPREGARVAELLERLARGETVALVSDAGMPGMSDPGERLVAAASEAGHVVEVVPGPSAPAAALAVSGLPAVPHVFLGFLPARQGERRRALEALRSRTETLVWFEAPHRLRESLEDAAVALGPRRACVARELTKVHEEVVRGTLPEVAETFRARGPGRGEVTVVVEGADPSAIATPYDGRRRREDSRGPRGGRSLEAPVQGDRAAGRPAGAGNLLARAAALEAVQARSRMSEPIVRVSRLTKVFKTFRREEGLAAALKSLVKRTATETAAVADVTFAIAPGEMVGYIGANGAGKSTTIKMLTGILTPTSGEVFCNGFVPHRDRTRYVATIGVVFGQRTQLWWDIAVVESFRLLKEIYGLTDAQYRERMDLFDRVLGLKAYLHQPVRKLSLGERMRCDLAASLLHRPPLLFLDEPTIGLDVVAKANVREFLQEINRHDGTTVLLTTHDLSDIETLCNRVIVIDHGRLLFDGALDELRDRILPVTSIVFDVKRAPDPSELVFDGVPIREVGLHRYRLDVDRRAVAPATAVKDIVNRFEVSDLTIEEPQIEDVVKRIYRDGVA